MAKKKEWENALHIYVRANDRVIYEVARALSKRRWRAVMSEEKGFLEVHARPTKRADAELTELEKIIEPFETREVFIYFSRAKF